MLRLDWRRSFIAATASVGLLVSCGTSLDSLEDSVHQKSGEIEEIIRHYTEVPSGQEEPASTPDGDAPLTESFRRPPLPEDTPMTTNILFGVPATLHGEFFTNGWDNASIPHDPESLPTDDHFFEESHQWDVDTLWWSTRDPYITFELDGAYLIESVQIQADDNDDYELAYHLPDSPPDQWKLLYQVPAVGGWGMQTRDTWVLPERVKADAFRIQAQNGDDWYSIGEVQIFGQAIGVTGEDAPESDDRTNDGAPVDSDAPDHNPAFDDDDDRPFPGDDAPQDECDGSCHGDTSEDPDWPEDDRVNDSEAPDAEEAAECAQIFNVVAGQKTGFNGTFFTNGWSSAMIPEAPRSVVTDYTYFPQSHQWDVETVWWSTEAPFLTIELDGEFWIEQLIVQADDNDRYEVAVHVPGTPDNEWVVVYEVPAIGGWGMQTRAPYGLETPVLSDAIRFNAIDGDGLYSVGEIEALGTANCN